jgi:signal transduction histidine kinase/ActR/RegA family two-component response regulator
MSLGTRLALLGAAVTAIVVGAVFVVLRRSTEDNVRRAFIDELGASQLVLQDVQKQNQTLLLQTAAIVSRSPTLNAALEVARNVAPGAPTRTAALATVQGEAVNVLGDLHQELWVVTDDKGEVLATNGAVGAPPIGTSLATMPVVRNAISDETTSRDKYLGVHRQSGVPLQVSAAPMVVHGYLVGIVLLGEKIDMPGRDSTVDIRSVVVAGDTVLASTLEPLVRDTRWLPQWVTRGESNPVVTLNGEEYVTSKLPLGLGDDGHPAELYMMRSMSAAVDPILSQLQRQFVLTGALAVLLVGVGGAMTSRATLRPLSRFVRFLRAEAAGTEYAQFDQPHAAAEIGSLTRAYNRLIQSVERGHGELQQRTTELATANQRLQRQVQERERAERALRESEEQLRQSQKLEALGALAGGVAHDFNNILSIILGYAEIVQTELPAESSQRVDVGKISDAAVRARALVRQLLAFSRKQVLQPQVLDLGRVVTDVQPLLRPLIGEDVTLEVNLAADLAPVLADLGQIEQVIVNLVVNARDAMPNGGRLLIETAAVTLAEGASHQPLRAGPVVMLSVTDTGIGMDAATRRRIFEPFFTTKPVGKGTGLGLATVYGIVRQSEGNITVFSEPGRGTTFRCYFPAAIAPALADPAAAAVVTASRGAETILLAEDEAELRALLMRALQGQGYRVLEASHGDEALSVAARHDGPIHLLVTDVIMPHRSGKEVAEQLSQERPGLRVLFMSGYSDEAIERHGILTPDSVYMQKPVSPESLARAVRDLLDAEFATSGDG